MTFNELLRSIVVPDHEAISRESLRTAIEENAIRRSGKNPIRLIPLNVARQFGEFMPGDVFTPKDSGILYQVID